MSFCRVAWHGMQEPEKLSSVLVADETESTYFVPETMSVWNVLEEVS